jgi:hypothetical protein
VDAEVNNLYVKRIIIEYLVEYAYIVEVDLLIVNHISIFS